MPFPPACTWRRLPRRVHSAARGSRAVTGDGGSVVSAFRFVRLPFSQVLDRLLVQLQVFDLLLPLASDLRLLVHGCPSSGQYPPPGETPAWTGSKKKREMGEAPSARMPPGAHRKPPG